LPRQNQARSYTDILGRTVKSERYWAEAPGGGRWLATTLRYDAGGRLLEQTDPGGNTVFFTYDGLGRRLTMNDPDMGGGVTCWPDLDGDGFGAGTPVSGSGCPAGYVTNNDDCYDSNANARPGQTSCFSTDRGDGSYDCDCSGSAMVCSPTTYLTACSGGCTPRGCTASTTAGRASPIRATLPPRPAPSRRPP